MADVMLSTIDNPYDPFTQFEEWYGFDRCQGYGTCELLARFAHTSQAVPDSFDDAEIERAIDEIVRLDPLDRYYKARPRPQ